MLRLIAFDLYGTLMSIRTSERDRRAWNTLAVFLSYHGVPYENAEVRDGYRRLVRAERKRLAAQYGHDDVEIDVRKIFEELVREKRVRQKQEAGERYNSELALTAAEVFRAATTRESARLYDGVREMLAALRGAGVKIALLSNAQYVFTEPELRGQGVLEDFDRVFISAHYEVKKPSEDFFNCLIAWAGEMGIERGNIMMVGNSPYDDIIPARRLGLQTCFVHSPLTEKDSPTPEADILMEEPDMKRLCSMLLQRIGK